MRTIHPDEARARRMHPAGKRLRAMTKDNVVQFPGSPVQSTEPDKPLRDAVLELAHYASDAGITVIDVRSTFDAHHGSASGVLSHLHRDGMLARTTGTRQGASIYVEPAHLHGRDTVPHGRDSLEGALLRIMADLLEQQVKPCTHQPPLAECLRCDTKRALDRYANMHPTE